MVRTPMTIVTRSGRYCEHKDVELFDCEYCKIESLQSELKEARAVISFYGDEWETWRRESMGHSIINEDVEITENNRPSGGKKARANLAKYPEGDE